MIFFSYFNNLIIEDPLFNNIKNNPLLNNIIVLYSIKIEEQKNGKLVVSKLIFEPNENLYLLNNNEANIKSEEEKNNEINFPKDNSYFKAIMKYFEQDKIRIRKSIKINVKYDDNIENYENNDIDIWGDLLIKYHFKRIIVNILYKWKNIIKGNFYINI